MSLFLLVCFPKRGNEMALRSSHSSINESFAVEGMRSVTETFKCAFVDLLVELRVHSQRVKEKTKIVKEILLTGMHSSRMRTARLLTVSQHALRRGMST